jgi:hypothetical protein
MNDYQKIMSVDKPIGEVYSALTEHISDWWSDDLTGLTAKEGDSFIISFDGTRKTMDITKAIPPARIEWKCVKAYIDLPSLENKSEWEGTRIIWSLVGTGPSKTELIFLHEGLNRHMECYDICENGWDTFLESLQLFLATGKGQPFLKK